MSSNLRLGKTLPSFLRQDFEPPIVQREKSMEVSIDYLGQHSRRRHQESTHQKRYSENLPTHIIEDYRGPGKRQKAPKERRAEDEEKAPKISSHRLRNSRRGAEDGKQIFAFSICLQISKQLLLLIRDTKQTAAALKARGKL